MTIPEIEKAYESTVDTVRFWDFSTSIWVTFFVGLALFILFILCVFFEHEELALVFLFCWILTSIVFWLCAMFDHSERMDAAADKWKKDYVIPYIHSLPLEKQEIVYIKIDPELSSETEGSHLFGTGYTYTKQVERTPLTISFKDNGVATETDWLETHMELTDEEKPYVEYYRLNEKIDVSYEPHQVEPGRYDMKVYLPESYEFTDIK
jgi:hypothetical protein